MALCVFAAVPTYAEETSGPNLSMYTNISDAAYQNLKKIVADWAAAKGVEVTITNGTGWTAYYDKLTLMVSTGIPADVVLTTEQAPPLAADGAFLDLGPYIARDKAQSEVLPVALSAFTLHGQVWGFPNSVYPFVMYYNKDLFDAAGLDHPTANWDADDWTWDDFLQAAKRMTRDSNGDGKTDQFGAYKLPDVFTWFGGEWIKPNSLEFNVQDPKLIEGFQQNVALKSMGIDCVSCGNTFDSGNAGMAFRGIQYGTRPGLLTGDFSWDMAAMPKAVRRVSEMSVNAYSIPRTSRNPDLAWGLIHYLTVDDKGSYLYGSQATGGLATSRGGRQAFLDGWSQRKPEITATVGTGSLKYAAVPPFRVVVAYHKLGDLRSEILDKANAGEISISAALEELARRGNPLLQQGIADLY